MSFEKFQSAELPSRDISQEFISLAPDEFWDFVDHLRKEKTLSIVIDWKDERTADMLKAFLEDDYPVQQKRSAAIRATKAQYRLAQNAFASGVRWIEVAE